MHGCRHLHGNRSVQLGHSISHYYRTGSIKWTGSGVGYKIARLAPSDPLPVVRLYLLKFLQLSKTEPPVGDQSV